MLLQLSARMQRLGQGFLEQCSPAVRFLAAEAAVERATTSKERIERVVPDLHKPIFLSENLERFEKMLETQEIARTKDFVELNATSMRDLKHFLKTYTNGLREDQPLGHELHNLMFVIPNEDDPEDLRRLVVKVGTAGGTNSHQLVYRCMQGLFREVGLSPNFVWDGAYQVPDRYLTYEHRKTMEEARMNAKVEGIQAIHRGEKLPENSGLKVFDPLAEQSADGSSPQPAEDASSPASPPQNTASAASAAAARGPAEADIELDETDFDVSNVTHMCKVIDENVRLLAMSPWIRVIGGLREEEEKKTSQDLIQFLNGLVPGFGPIVEKVWQGEVDEQALAEELKALHDVEMAPYAEASVAQLCRCTEKLLEDHGPPDAESIVERKHLLNTVQEFSCTSDRFQQILDAPHW